MSEAPRAKMNPLLRMLLFVLGVLVAAVPLGLLLPDSAIQAVLQRFYPAAHYNLDSPDLLLTWRWLLAGCGGLVICVMLAIPIGLARRKKHRAERVVWPAPVQQVLDAVAIEDVAAVAAGCEQIARQCGDEAVPPLLQALDGVRDDAIRRHLAATLYRLGRAVTAETTVRLRR